MDKISIIVPCYNEDKMIELFYKETEKELKKIKGIYVEYIFVDDGSKDNTLNEIKKLRESDERVRYVSFSRNFGKESALYAGLEAADGDYIVTMDVDLQDPPKYLPEMYKVLKDEDYDVVATRRVTRKGEPPIRSIFSRMFYKLINKMSDVEMVDGARDFRMMTPKVKDAIVSMKEYSRYYKGIASFVGFKTKWLEYENVKRAKGETKWSFWKLVKYAVEGIVDFSTVPLVISAILGIIMCIISVLAIIFIIVRTLAFGDPTSGWPSLACIVIFIGGVQLLSLGIIGQYLSKTYLETKNRPIYIVREDEKSSK